MTERHDACCGAPAPAETTPRAGGNACCGASARDAGPSRATSTPAAAACHGGATAAASCHDAPAAGAAAACCAPTAAASDGDCCDTGAGRSIDRLLWGSVTLVAAGYLGHLTGLAALGPGWLEHYAHGAFEFMNAMWWGLLIGVVFVGLLARVPRETIVRLLGRGGTWRGLVRATGAGVLLDLCSHGILAVGMKLYERGASTGQVMAFLIASPWNSISLTLILFGLIGVGWTLLFILLSLVIALISGRIFDRLVANGHLPANPHTLAGDVTEAPGLMQLIREARVSRAGLGAMLRDGLAGSRVVIRWALFGVVIAAALRAFVPPDFFAQWFGPTLVGLMLTAMAATIIEVCSEGSVPIAADLMNRAAAPGNTFTFLMAGVSTDYTEIMSIRDTTRSWKVALFLPLVTLPQVLVLGFLLNLA